MKSKTAKKRITDEIHFDFSIPIVQKKKVFGNLFVSGVSFNKGNIQDIAIKEVVFDNADVSKVLEAFGGMQRIKQAAMKHAKILETF